MELNPLSNDGVTLRPTIPCKESLRILHTHIVSRYCQVFIQ